MVALATGVAKFSLDSVESLGYRGTDGLPYAFKVLDAVAKIAMGRQWKHIVASAIVTLNANVKPASLIYAVFAQPFVDLPKLRKIAFRVFEALKTCYEEGSSRLKAALVKMIPDLMKLVITFSVYVYSCAQALNQWIALGAWAPGPMVQDRILLVSTVASGIFATLALVGTALKFGLSAYQWYKLDPLATIEEQRLASVNLKHGCLGFIRVVLKVMVVVAASYFTLVPQALVTLGVVGIEIYLKRHKAELIRRSDEGAAAAV